MRKMFMKPLRAQMLGAKILKPRDSLTMSNGSLSAKRFPHSLN
jgi:hypothetical protein